MNIFKLIYLCTVEKKSAVLTYRYANPEECRLVAHLTEYTFRESWTEDGNESDVTHYVNENFSQEVIKHELKGSSIIYLLAFNEEVAVGYIKLERNLQPEGHQYVKPFSISRVYVMKSFQGNQIGSRLLQQAIEIATKENFEMIWLGVWNENYRALHLYERFGFERFGTYQFIMGKAISNDYLMMKKL